MTLHTAQTAVADPFEGWFIDEADPDVGIFGDAVIHECDENVEGDEATTDVRIIDVGGDKFVTVVTTFTCPVCEGTTSFAEHEPREWFEDVR